MIGEDNVFPAFPCSRYFIEVQGFKVEETVMYQDNLSTIIFENNERLSSVNQTKHIRIIYFMIKYTIDMGGG